MQSNHVLIENLKKKVDETISSLIPSGASVALIDFPNHSNVGDSAIWLGQRAVLARLKLKDTYNCDWRTYSFEHMNKRIKPDTTILLSGGGNLGDIWPEGQHFRESIIASFPANQIIQLPQAIHFQDKANLLKAKMIFDNHPHLTILARDRASVDLAKNFFRAPCMLCPDMAFGLGSLQRTLPFKTDTLLLLRSDIESCRWTLPKMVRSTDWLEENIYFKNLNSVLTGLSPSIRPTWQKLYGGIGYVYNLFARLRLDRGLKTLSEGRTVITDRLHGHILCLLMGIPHILLDNSYGKVSGFYNTWTQTSEITELAQSTDHALMLARDMVSRLNH